MFDGNQVLRFEKYKSSDLGGLGVELEDRKGTGNYDKDRTKFNVEFVSLNNKTLMSKVYSTLKENEIYYGENKKNINLLNGAIITSGQEFFKSLGMNFIKTDRTYQVGEKKGQPIERVNINTNADIPEKVLEFFKDSHEYLSNLVGKENVIYSAVHFDEDTPHMHFYFLPVVNEVKRKVFETDSNGKILKKEITGKDGNKKLVPIVAKDENGKAIYKTEYGKFLNLDQFWKQLGGKSSYAKIQDEFNEYINSKGFNLFRGNTGANIEHQTKAEYELNENKKEIISLEKDINLYQKINEINLKTNQEILNINQEEVLSPSKDVFKRYKDKDVVNLINYTKEVNKDNLAAKSTIKKQEIRIEKLNNEVNELKSGKTISEANKKIKQQEIDIKAKDETIKKQSNKIFNLEIQIESLTKELLEIKQFFGRIIEKAFHAVQHLLGRKKQEISEMKEIDENYVLFEKQLDNINLEHGEAIKNKNKDYTR